MMKLKDKVALVTGAARGIGKAIVLTLAQEGASVVLADVDEKGIRQVAQEIEARGHRAKAVKVDVSQRQAHAIETEMSAEWSDEKRSSKNPYQWTRCYASLIT